MAFKCFRFHNLMLSSIASSLQKDLGLRGTDLAHWAKYQSYLLNPNMLLQVSLLILPKSALPLRCTRHATRGSLKVAMLSGMVGRETQI